MEQVDEKTKKQPMKNIEKPGVTMLKFVKKKKFKAK